MGIRKSRVINGNGSIPAISVCMSDTGTISLYQRGQEVSQEAWIAGNEGIETDGRMAAQVHAVIDWMNATP